MKNIKVIKEPNRNTTLESLEAALALLTAKTKDEFIKLYRQATHDDAGGSCWFYMQGNKTKI